MWGDEIRTRADGKGVPLIKRLSWSAYHTDGTNEDGTSWDVTYPDLSFGGHFKCCGRTDARMFDTWPEALAFALAKSWEP